MVEVGGRPARFDKDVSEREGDAKEMGFLGGGVEQGEAFGKLSHLGIKVPKWQSCDARHCRPPEGWTGGGL